MGNNSNGGVRGGIADPAASASLPEGEDPKTKEEHHKLVDWFCAQMREKKADCKLPTPSVRQRWADIFRLMTDRDNRTPRQIAQVIRFATQDEFWSPNIRSANKLREKFDALELAMQRGTQGKGGKPSPPPPAPKRVERQRKLESYLEQMHAEAEDKPKHVPDLDAYIAAKKAADSDGQDKAGTGKDNSNNEQPGAAQAADTNKEATG